MMSKSPFHGASFSGRLSLPRKVSSTCCMSREGGRVGRAVVRQGHAHSSTHRMRHSACTLQEPHAATDAMATAFRYVVLLASVFLLSCGLASVRAQAACMLDDQREDCGEWLMTCILQCSQISRGCPVRPCTGYVGVNEQICSRKGCCWSPRDVSFTFASTIAQ